MSSRFHNIISSESEIRELIGYSSEIVQKKAVNRLDKHCREFISMSTIQFLATSDDQGCCDVSPRGDSPGSVLVLDDHHLVIPERPGNRRIDSLRNILLNPHIGMIFIIPGLEETLRVNGKAYVIQDEDILDKLKAKANDKKPLLAIGVEVEECYIHCAKAFMRSKLWNTESWPQANELPSVPAILKAHVNSSQYTEEVIKQGLQESYEKRLY